MVGRANSHDSQITNPVAEKCLGNFQVCDAADYETPKVWRGHCV